MTYILYHEDQDGFGAAFAHWRLSRMAGVTDKAAYIPVQHGRVMPTIEDNATVFILDFSYPREQLVELNARTSLYVIDHHATAQKDLEGLDFTVFDMNHSGAVLAWNFFVRYFKLSESVFLVPDLLKYVEDADLYRWSLPCSREIVAGIRSYPFEMGVWDKLEVNRLFHAGVDILRYSEMLVEATLKETFDLYLGEYRVPCVNCSTKQIQSRVCDRLLELHPDAMFSAYYFDQSDGTRTYGLRCKSNFDVSAIAKRYGGGGHQKAAGFQVAAPVGGGKDTCFAWRRDQ